MPEDPVAETRHRARTVLGPVQPRLVRLRPWAATWARALNTGGSAWDPEAAQERRHPVEHWLNRLPRR